MSKEQSSLFSEGKTLVRASVASILLGVAVVVGIGCSGGEQGPTKVDLAPGAATAPPPAVASAPGAPASTPGAAPASGSMPDKVAPGYGGK